MGWYEHERGKAVGPVSQIISCPRLHHCLGHGKNIEEHEVYWYTYPKSGKLRVKNLAGQLIKRGECPIKEKRQKSDRQYPAPHPSYSY